ncbi:MAG: S8 family serine peptidase, partial [Muribaculaceae bacterium]|nr:S8 family serine peptidase [Muribaculaceae bacterium]
MGRLEAAGAEVSLRAGNIVIVETTLGAAESLAATEGVVTVSLPEQLSMDAFTSSVGYDTSRGYLGLDKVRAGVGDNKTPYLGKGVIVGVLDGGIDPNHIMFDDAEGNPRVKRIINHVQVGSNRLTQKVETPEGVRKFTTDDNSLTHGTHVAGIMAGSFDGGPDGPDFTGPAPEAEIAMKGGATDNARLIQGLQYITDYARSEGKPLVVNISLGSNSGPHDGTDEFPAALQEYASMEGVTICVSSGNEGADQAFLYHEFSADEPLRTFIAPSRYTDALYSQVSMFPMYPQAIGSMEIWADDDTPFGLYADLYELAADAPVLRSSFCLEPFKTSYLTTTGRAPVAADVVKGDDELFNSQYVNSFFGGETAVYPANNRYFAELNFQLECPDAEKYQGGIMVLRVEPGKPGQKIYVYGQPLNSYFGFSLLSGEVPGFTGSFANGSINAMAGAKDVITVGSYVSHNFNPDVASQYTVGTTSTFSSWGNTPDGRLHPLVSAPGNFIVSSMSGHYYDIALKGTEYAADERYVYYGHTAADGKTHYWTPMSGTSMASPYMAGIIACWLSADPTLTTAEILEIARRSAESQQAM